VTLLRREEWRSHPEGGYVRRLLKPLLDHPNGTVRMLAAMGLPFLFEPGELIAEIASRLQREDDPGVIEVLVGALCDQARADPGGVDTALSRLSHDPRWSVLAGAPDDRTQPPNAVRTQIGDLLLQALAFLAFVRVTPFVVALTDEWRQHPANHAATSGRFVAMARPYLNPPVGWNTDVQERAFAFLNALADECITITNAAQEHLSTTTALDEDERRDLESAAWIALCIARELYHASGAFQTQEERLAPDERIVATGFCALALPLIEKLAQVPSAGIAHHLVQTAAFLSRIEPRRAFLLIAGVVTGGAGYEYEPLGETEVLDLVDLYLAERRQVILGDPECLSALRQLLETYVRAGSDRAVRRVQDLGDLFR
jgi:hypothetical protein